METNIVVAIILFFTIVSGSAVFVVDRVWRERFKEAMLHKEQYLEVSQKYEKLLEEVKALLKEVLLMLRKTLEQMENMEILK